VPVNVTTPNLVIWERMLGVPGDSRQTVQAKAEKQLGSGGYPWLGYADQIVLVKEANEWHLIADFAQRARVAELHEQALSAYHAFDYDRALSLYRQIQELLETAPFSGSGGLSCAFGREMKAVEAARASGPAVQSYLSRVVLKNIVNKPATSGAPGLFGQITNSGDRALDQVELTVSYGAEPGKPVYAEKHQPIATPLEFTDFNLPIVPFSPGETRGFGIALKAPMQIQEQNKPTVMVTGIIFSEPVALSPKLAGVQVGAQDHEHGNRTPGAKAIAMPGSSATSKSK
jgi:hypothetical protein